MDSFSDFVASTDVGRAEDISIGLGRDPEVEGIEDAENLENGVGGNEVSGSSGSADIIAEVNVADTSPANAPLAPSSNDVNGEQDGSMAPSGVDTSDRPSKRQKVIET